jgi:hypothetical protein
MLAHSFRIIAVALVPALTAWPASAQTDQPISPAENRLFLDNHLGNLPASAVLRYAYSKTGSLEPSQDGSVKLTVGPSAEAAAHKASVEFSNGGEKVGLPVIDAATANPVILFFLERDVHEMQRRTGGQASYFRKRVRMALANAAEIQPATFEFAGKRVTGQTITVHPYRDDPLHARFEKLTGKSYIFVLSDDIPGTLYQMRTLVDAPGASDGNAPVLAETLTLLESTP